MMDCTALARRMLRNELQQWVQSQLRSQTSEPGGVCSPGCPECLGQQEPHSASSFPWAGWALGASAVLGGLCRARGCTEPLHCIPSPPPQEERLSAQGGPRWDLRSPYKAAAPPGGWQGAGSDPSQALRGHPVPIRAGCGREETWAGLNPLSSLDKQLLSPGPLAVEPSLGIPGRLIPLHLLSSGSAGWI